MGLSGNNNLGLIWSNPSNYENIAGWTKTVSMEVAVVEVVVVVVAIVAMVVVVLGVFCARFRALHNERPALMQVERR